MSNLFRRILLLRSPSSLFAHGFSESSLRSLRYLSTSSEIVSSPKSASLPSNAVQLNNKGKAVIDLLANHGFSESQISYLANRYPPILSSNPEKTLLPKLLFFQSKAHSSSEIFEILRSDPWVLSKSLNERIIPAFNYLQAVLGSEEKTLATIKHSVSILSKDLRICLGPNIEILKQIGVPDSNILKYLQYQPRVFMTNSIQFKETVERVKEMGFNTQQWQFVDAVFCLRSMTKSTWDKKVEAYRKWGLSEEEIRSAFRKHPRCMTFSEDKINGAMDFFINKMEYESSFAARRPILLQLSLKKRLLPRGHVYEVLLSKGLIKKHQNLPFLLKSPEKHFIEKYINPHKEQIPGLLELYEEKLMDSKR